jgi:hypothetical protein
MRLFLTRRFALVLAVAACSTAAGCHRGPAATAPSAVLLPPALHDARLPERLDDSTFWRMITEFSEPGGYFQSENFVSNEMGLQFVIPRLRESIDPGGVYIGVGPEQNFTYIGALRPRIAFIVDIRRQNLLQHLWYKAIYELSSDRVEFVSRLFARPRPPGLTAASSIDSIMNAFERVSPEPALFRKTFDEVRQHLVVRRGFPLDSSDLQTLRYVDSIFYVNGPTLNYSSGNVNRFGGMRGMPSFSQIVRTTDESGLNRGFLGSDAAYQSVRELQRRNLVVPLVGNFAGPHAIRAVGRWLGERGATVSAFYCSNVEQYLFQSDQWVRFYRNIETLPLDSTSLFIRSVTNRMRFVGPQSTMMLSQLTSPMAELVRDVSTGQVRSYMDVVSRSN